MKCGKCGWEMDSDSRFCEQCGAEAVSMVNEKPNPIKESETDSEKESTKEPTKESTRESENRPATKLRDGVVDSSGRWRWTYGMNMWTNPTILVTIAKVLLLSAQFPVLLSLFLGLEDGFAKALMTAAKIEGILVAALAALLIMAYPLVATINGGRYCVLFEMDAAGVRHTQLNKQFKKQQVLAMITVLAGAAEGNPTTTGAGLMAGAKKSSYSRFDRVRQIVICSRRQVIYLNESVQHNQIYAEAEDFDAVKDYILARASKAKVKYKR